MKPRYPYLLALALTLPLASCRFVGARPDFSVMGDALSPVESDSVYVESKPTGSTRLAAYQPPAPAPTPAATPQQASSFSGLGDIFSPAGQQQPAPSAPPPTPTAQVQPAPQATAPSSPALYTVRPGDSLARIARAHRVPLGSLASVNGIDLQKPLIKPGQQLRIPQGGSAVVGAPRATTPPPAPKPAPAAPAASTVPVLKPALKPGTPAPASAARPASAAKPAASATLPPAPRGKYRVCAGDTLYRIARRHSITLAELLRANNLTEEGARNVRVGTLLTIPAPQP